MHFFEWLPVAIFYYILPVLIVIKWLQFIRLSSIAKNYSIPLLSPQTVFQETVTFIVPARNEEFTIEKYYEKLLQPEIFNLLNYLYPFYGFIIIVLMIHSYIQLSIFKKAQWKQRIYYSVNN